MGIWCVTLEHLQDILIHFRCDVQHRAGGSGVLRNLEGKDVIFVGIKREIVLHINGRILCDNALQINGLPRCSIGVILHILRFFRRRILFIIPLCIL